MGDPNIEVTEESRDASQEAKGKAMEALSEGVILFLLSLQYHDHNHAAQMLKIPLLNFSSLTTC